MEPEKNMVDSIEKFDIKLKSQPKDGVILQLHHTIRQSNGESRRIRFVAAAFDAKCEKLACADSWGNLFILDFAELQFWKLTGVGACSAVQFISHLQDTLLVATCKNYDISFMDVETGTATRTLAGHTAPVKHISFSNEKICNLITASPVEAIIWDLRNYTKFFTLNTFKGAQIQQILFTPAGDYLVSCFQNDTIQIWKNESMKSVKQIVPNELKRMRSIAFTMNGRAMAMAGLASTLILFNMDTWKALKSIDLSKFNISGAQQIAFIALPFDGGCNKILAILSNDCSLYFLDLEALKIICTITPESSGIKRFTVSTTGKYFSCILQLGEVNIYNTSYVLEMAVNSNTKVEKPYCASTSVARVTAARDQITSKAEVEHNMRTCMDSLRLRRILMQYGEYPDRYRSIIWKSLLNTPRNKAAYAALVDMGVHQVFQEIEKQFTIHSTGTLNSLKRLLSCLAHWCPLFGVMKFLPGFTFPFVKVLQKDPMFLFECVASILINYCQLWFEYAPFPPISILAMIENVLADHDQQLLNHFCEVGVTSQVYALKILETAFSEVLSCSEWLILWDHILSNEPAFMLMAVVSYCIVQRNAIRKLKTLHDMEHFFHTQNPIDKKTFLKKTYNLLNDTSADIHPRKFFRKFSPLEKGDCYQQFTAYPVATITLRLARKDRSHSVVQKMSLRNLITKSQERIIEEGLLDEAVMRADCYPTADATQSCEISPVKPMSPSSERPPSASTNGQVSVGPVYPAAVRSRSKNKIRCDSKHKRDSVKHLSRKNYRRASNDKNYALENEIKKLMPGSHLEANHSNTNT